MRIVGEFRRFCLNVTRLTKIKKAANDRFVRDVILPYLSSEEDKLNSWLVTPFFEA